MKPFPIFLFSIVCMVATSFNTSRTAHANNDMTPIGFQFYASDNTPISNETFHLQLDQEVKSLTTKSDGLAFIEIPNKNIKPHYTLTTSNNQTFTVEPNKLYRLTSSSNIQRNIVNTNNQSISINVLSKTYHPLNNVEVKLIADNQELSGVTDQNGNTTINIPTTFTKSTKFNVKINGVDSHSTISLGEDKYYTFNSDDKTTSTFEQNTNQPTQIDQGQQSQSQITENPNSNHIPSQNQTYQISVIKDSLIPNPNKLTNDHTNKEKKTKSETSKLPETGQSSKHFLNYLISALLICISSILFFIFKKKRSKQ
ncbi:LPXTG cell wall anchor domain-containing protein [Staphylococcus sp. GDY8P145P]|uniref:LPXTG cell wall anchor domain-containing protein n=1 Tax=Mammaliicoccus sciuri TaxID=1296 RepID=UPI00194EB14E